MESILTLKAFDEEAGPICIICEKIAPKGTQLVDGGEKAIRSLQKAVKLRELKFDPKNRGAINRVKVIDTDTVRYHSNCFASFTSECMINRLTDLELNSQTVENNNVESTANANPTIWTECILCQVEKKEHKRRITTAKKQQEIRDLAEADYSLNLRIGGNSTDLIEKKTLYHTNCLNKFNRNKKNADKASVEAPSSNLALKEICAELYVAAEKGEVCTLYSFIIQFLIY